MPPRPNGPNSILLSQTAQMNGMGGIPGGGGGGPNSSVGPNGGPGGPGNGNINMNGGGPGSGGVGMLGVSNGLPHAGQQTDVNFLWAVVEELSSVLAANRAQMEGIMNGVQRIQQQPTAPATTTSTTTTTEQAASAPQPNGETAATDSTPAVAVQLAATSAELHRTARERDALRDELTAYGELQESYEATYNTLMDKIRRYASEHANAAIAIHRHYNALLESERRANLQLRIAHGQWQARLGRAAELARQALKERSEEVSPLETRIRELQAENRILRGLAGWPVDESDSEDEGAAEGSGGFNGHPANHS